MSSDKVSAQTMEAVRLRILVLNTSVGHGGGVKKLLILSDRKVWNLSEKVREREREQKGKALIIIM